MFTAETCPFIVIGVPTYVDKSEAAVGFAKASRRLKSIQNPPFEIEDLTSALQRIESQDFDRQWVYSIPADSGIFDPRAVRPNQDAETESLLGVIEKTSDGAAREEMARELLVRSLDCVLSWNFDVAQELLRSVLRFSRNERNRDEALNLMAACLEMSGNTETAVQALSKAVEGEWNLKLQVNLAVLAVSADPARAVEQMAFLIAGARSAEDKVGACVKAVAMWRTHQSESIGSDDEDDFEPLPENVIREIVNVLKHRDITESQFFDLGMFLARVAPHFVVTGQLAGAKFDGRPSMALVSARAKGFGEYLEELPRQSARASDADSFIQDKVEEIVQEAVESMFNDNPTFGNNIAFMFLDNGLDASTFWRVWMRAKLILNLASNFGDDERPADKLLGWVQEARQGLQRLTLNPEQRDVLVPMVDGATKMIAILFLRPFYSEWVTVARRHDEIMNQMRGFFGRMSADRSAVGSASRAICEWCVDQSRIMDKLVALGIPDPEIVSDIREAQPLLRQVQSNLNQYR